MFELHVSNLMHVGMSFVELGALWTYIIERGSSWTCVCRVWLLLVIHLSDVAQVGLTFVERGSVWAYRCRTWRMSDLYSSNLTNVMHLSNLTQAGSALVELGSC